MSNVLPTNAEIVNPPIATARFFNQEDTIKNYENTIDNVVLTRIKDNVRFLCVKGDKFYYPIGIIGDKNKSISLDGHVNAIRKNDLDYSISEDLQDQLPIAVSIGGKSRKKRRSKGTKKRNNKSTKKHLRRIKRRRI